ncbi:MAG: DNA polymerase III subunit alpha [Bacteriovoracaceae bacterium]
MKELLTYLGSNYIQYSVVDETTLLIDNKQFRILTPTEGRLFDKDFSLIVNREEIVEIDCLVYFFGGRWYYCPVLDIKKPKLLDLLYLGTPDLTFETDAFLGIHSSYEILNGSGLYIDWIKKAKFLGVKHLGICEKNSLAGALKFQIACLDNGIHPIIGASYVVANESATNKYQIKVYVEDEEGWQNILFINKMVNVVNQGFIVESDLFDHLKGLQVVLNPRDLEFEKVPLRRLQNRDVDFYYQLDIAEFEDNQYDKSCLLNLKKYVDSDLEPIAITDAYYINKEDSDLKPKLNNISDTREFKSSQQYFKSKEEYYFELSDIVQAGKLDELFAISLENESILVSKCQFQISQEGKHLPVYFMTEEEQKKFPTNNDLFWHLIEKGLSERVTTKRLDKYLNRIETETRIIEMGGFVDYFLILWDIIKWSNENGILTGLGRGSAAGSLVAYLLRITHLDPFQFDLLFERFLNEGRVGKSLPDIDCDFMASRRDEVKHYMERKYGKEQVCSVGSYNTLKLKSAIKDFSRQESIEVQEVNYITSILDDGFGEEHTFLDRELIFKEALRAKPLKAFLQNHPDVIHNAIRVIGSPRSQSIHPCATLILPNEKSIYDWIPVKTMLGSDGQPVLVSEWEGGELEAAGFLKEDILGIRQLDKFASILSLIKLNHNVEVDIYNLPVVDERVIRYYKKGWTQDVFHFGAKGLTEYCRQSQPDSIDDLIAAIALYRPGPIESNLHNEYILRKNGSHEVEYLWGTESITGDTYGILIYQEQIMQICVELGGFTLVEADDIRKAMGKKKKEILSHYKPQFIDKTTAKGCPLTQAVDIWNTLEKFASYSFNKSHAAAYTLTGWICQYLKVYYPLEYWTVAFEYIDSSRKDELVPQYISEISQTGSIQVSTPDINYSQAESTSDSNSKTIFWGISTIKFIGSVATDQIIEDRSRNGKYFSFEEFLSRHTFTGSKVNKTHIENLIVSGAFDKIEDIKLPIERKRLLDFYYQEKKTKLDDQKFRSEHIYQEWYWFLRQREFAGIGFLDYESLCMEHLPDFRYLDPQLYQDESIVDRNYHSVGGYIIQVTERNASKKGKYCSILIDTNYQYLWITIFPEMYEKISANVDLIGSEKSILLVSGKMIYDDFKKQNILKVWDESDLIILK